ncbi:uncharacterized protein LOC143986979 isoform X2 [Lithobates pipiens]
MSKQEHSQSNTVEMTSLPNSLDSNMDLSESLEDGNEDGSEDQDDQTNSSSNNSSSDESPPSQDQSPISVKFSYTQAKVISPNKNQEVSIDYGSQDVEKDGTCRVKVQTTTTNGSQEVSPDEINGNLVHSTITVSSLQVQVTTNGSQELLGGNNNGSQEIFVNGVTEISVTLSRENSNERRNLKRKQGSVEEEVGKEKKFK